MNLFKLLCRGVNSISAAGKYNQKPRAMQIYLHFLFLFREEPRAWESMNRISAAGSSRKIYAEVHVVLSISGKCPGFVRIWFTFPVVFR